MKNAKNTVKKQQTIRSKTAPVQSLNGVESAKDLGLASVNNLTRGRYIKPDFKKDTDMSIWKDLPSELGQKVVSDKHVKYFKDKKEKAEQFEVLRLASQLIDPRNPETQDFAYAVFPDLFNVPEQTFRDHVGMQLAIRAMIRAGRVNGAEDIQLVYRVICTDFVFPISPLWDYEGVVLGSISGNAQTQALLQNMKSAEGYGLFNPYKYTTNGTQDLAQMEIKIALLQRLFPNLRNRPKSEVKTFINQLQARYSDIQKLNFGMLEGIGGVGVPNVYVNPDTKDQYKKLIAQQ